MIFNISSKTINKKFLWVLVVFISTIYLKNTLNFHSLNPRNRFLNSKAKRGLMRNPSNRFQNEVGDLKTYPPLLHQEIPLK